MASAILNTDGKPFYTEAEIESRSEMAATQRQVQYLQRQIRMEIGKRQQVRAKWDAAQTVLGNSNHWGQADNLDPHGAASYEVRRLLRSRSRYEVIENNPYLKGIVLTIANDFVGRHGPRLQITDKRIAPERRKLIEDRYAAWQRVIKLRKKLWRMRMARLVDGETVVRAYTNRNRRSMIPISLDFQVLECDRMSSQLSAAVTPAQGPSKWNEIDGVRFDNYENPVQYHILDQHPHTTISYLFTGQIEPMGGKWVDAKYVLHWFRQDRGWLRGIPELAPSLPLCALLRRYTLAVVRHAETNADITVLLESDLPAYQDAWTDGNGNLLEDDPFDTFPLEMGTAMTLPKGYRAKDLGSVPLGVQYDAFVGALLREITRPILSPFNISSGSSKDSNMASAVVDTHLYAGGQNADRADCECEVLDPMTELWWYEAIRIPGYIGDDLLAGDPQFRNTMPDHVWRWDRVGLDHTDPARVAQAIKILHDKRLLTDRDYQEGYMNRDLEDWQEDIKQDDAFRETLVDSGMTMQPNDPANDVPEPAPSGKDKDD